MASCSWGAQPNLALATNYQDLWYAFPADSEKGWGINFTHQGNTIFATWFTFAVDGQPLWLVAALDKYPGAAERVHRSPEQDDQRPALQRCPVRLQHC